MVFKLVSGRQGTWFSSWYQTDRAHNLEGGARLTGHIVLKLVSGRQGT